MEVTDFARRSHNAADIRKTRRHRVKKEQLQCIMHILLQQNLFLLLPTSDDHKLPIFLRLLHIDILFGNNIIYHCKC